MQRCSCVHMCVCVLACVCNDCRKAASVSIIAVFQAHPIYSCLEKYIKAAFGVDIFNKTLCIYHGAKDVMSDTVYRPFLLVLTLPVQHVQQSLQRCICSICSR